MEENKQLTKQDLTERVRELEQKLAASDKSLSDMSRVLAIKDSEAISLKNEVSKSRQSLAEEIKRVKDDYSQKTINKDLELESLREKAKGLEKVDKLEKALEKVSRENKLIVQTANAHLGAFRNFMKSIQGSLDNAIELEAIITSSLQTKKEE